MFANCVELTVVVRCRYPNHVWAIDFQFDETADGPTNGVYDTGHVLSKESDGAVTPFSAEVINAKSEPAALINNIRLNKVFIALG